MQEVGAQESPSVSLSRDKGLSLGRQRQLDLAGQMTLWEAATWSRSSRGQRISLEPLMEKCDLSVCGKNLHDTSKRTTEKQ